MRVGYGSEIGWRATPFDATPSSRAGVARSRTSWRMDSTRAAVKIGMMPPFLRSTRPESSVRMLPKIVSGPSVRGHQRQQLDEIGRSGAAT